MREAIWGVLAFGLAFALLSAFIPLLRRLGAIDVPIERSMHDRPVVRGAGLALIVAFLVTVLVSGNRAGNASGALFITVGLASLLGFADDLRSIEVPWRLGAMALFGLFSAVLVTTADQKVLVAAVVVVWIVGFTNSFNFMDGINGISSLTTLILGVGWVFVGNEYDDPLIITSAAALAGVSLAFIPFNFPSGRVFLGDAGSYGLGTAVTAIVVLSVRAGAPVQLVILPCMLYLFDTISTVVWRYRRGERILSAHRSHAYQLLASQHGHTKTSLLVASITVALSALMVAGLNASTALQWLLFAVGCAACAAFVIIPRVDSRRAAA